MRPASAGGVLTWRTPPPFGSSSRRSIPTWSSIWQAKSLARDLELVIPTLRSNLLSSVNLLTAVAEHGCSRLVLAGSMEEPELEDGGSLPCSPYARLQVGLRWLCAPCSTPSSEFRPSCFAYFMVYGPGQIDVRKLIPYVILSILRGEAPKLTSGDRPVDWVFVEDVIDGLIAAALRPRIQAGQPSTSVPDRW